MASYPALAAVVPPGNIAGTPQHPVLPSGRTTGWTRGAVAGTCVHVNVSGSIITQLCQTLVSAGVGSGDSGSPVFRRRGTGSSVTLVGILWGGSGSELYVFSPMANIEAELGALRTF